MPSDIALPRHLMKQRKREGYAAICAIGTDADPGVFRLGAAEDVEVLLSRLQLGTWHELRFLRTVWTPGLELANSIVKSAETWLTGASFGLGRHWFRVGLDILDDLIRAEAIRRNASLWTPDELALRLRQAANREADRFAEGQL